jgi:4-amino-4-deoxy-L-arabinose transferase-like glycosyltransferase
VRIAINMNLSSFTSQGIFLFFLSLVLLVKMTILLGVIPILHKAHPDLYQIERFPDEYADIAANLIKGNGYRVCEDTAETMIREPGYILALACVFYLFGKSLAIVQLFNCLISIFTVIIIRRLCYHIGLSRMLATIAGVIYMLHPAIVLAETRGGVEVLYSFLCVSYMLLLYEAVNGKTVMSYAKAGWVLGVACLVKSTIILFPLFLYPVLLFVKGKREIFLVSRNIVLMIVCMLMIQSVWVIRNFYVSGEFVPTMTLAGSIAQEGLYASEYENADKPYFELGFSASDWRAELARAQGFAFERSWHLYFYSSKEEVQFDRLLLGKVYEEYRMRPRVLLRTIFNNAWRFWFQGRTLGSTTLNTLVVLPFLLVTIVGVLFGCKYKLNIALLLVFIVYFYLVHLPLQGLARYHVPLIPLLASLASISFLAPIGRR